MGAVPAPTWKTFQCDNTVPLIILSNEGLYGDQWLLFFAGFTDSHTTLADCPTCTAPACCAASLLPTHHYLHYTHTFAPLTLHTLLPLFCICLPRLAPPLHTHTQACPLIHGFSYATICILSRIAFGARTWPHVANSRFDDNSPCRHSCACGKRCLPFAHHFPTTHHLPPCHAACLLPPPHPPTLPHCQTFACTHALLTWTIPTHPATTLLALSW